MKRFVLLAGAVLVFGCAGVQHPTVQTLECRMALLEPYLGPLTEELVTEGLKNPTTLVDSLLSLGLDPAKVIQLGDSWRACSGQPPATSVQAPPPMPSNKVL